MYLGVHIQIIYLKVILTCFAKAKVPECFESEPPLFQPGTSLAQNDSRQGG
jgi:hypothetical protein